MTPEQFQRVQDLFRRCSAIPADLRRDLLDEQCADDAEVRGKVERMLDLADRQAAEPTAAGFLGGPALGVGFHVDSAVELDRFIAGEFARTGRYRLLEPLGEGGFGTVYRAEQLLPVRRIVAIKVIKPGMDTRRVLARFEAERQALARMNHPGIAAVFDAGATESGRPYFTMELAEGSPITAHCNAARLDIQGRISLFLQVCEAIQHAHQKGVIHRDLKPSNIVVTDIGERAIPKVIDFGIAKAALDDTGSEPFTVEHGQFIGTPEYVSPEQASGDRDIDTRADIFSMGIVLYELMAGTTPLDRATAGSADIERIRALIRESAPMPPSSRVRALGQRAASVASERRTDPASLRRTLRGDLDWIVMKAIEKNRAARYDTIGAMADDLRRYLNREPIAARPQSGWYRFRRFAARNRVAMTAGTLFLLLLVGGIVGTSMGMLSARRSAAIAREEAAIAKAVSDFLNFDLLMAIEVHAKGHDATMRELLDIASQRIEGRFPDQPRIELAVRCSLGRAYKYLGQFEIAERHLRRATELGRVTSLAASTDRVAALLMLAEVCNATGRSADSIPLLAEALPVAIESGGESGWDTLLVTHNLASSYRILHDFAAAEPLYLRVIETRRALPDDSNNRRELLIATSNLASMYMTQDRLEQAEPMVQDVLERARRHLGPEHTVTMKATNDLAGVLRRRGRFEEAEAVLLPLIEIIRRLRGDNHLHTLYVESELATLRTDQGRLEDALQVRMSVAQRMIDTLGINSAPARTEIGSVIELCDRLGRKTEAELWRTKLNEPIAR